MSEETERLLSAPSTSQNRVSEENSTMTKENQKLGSSNITLVSQSGGGSYGPARRLTQYTAAVAVTLGAFAAGTILSWTSPTKEQLMNGAMGFPVTEAQYGWIGSLMTLGAAAVCFPIAIIMDMIGRKITMLSLIVPFTVGWCLIYWSENIGMVYAGRFLTGLAGGAFCVSAPLYTSEIAQKEIRGTLGSYFQLLLTVGILFVDVVGAYASIQTLTLCCLIVPFIFGVAFFFQPETPVYYVKKGKIDEARKSLQFFRGSAYNVDMELQEMIDANKDAKVSCDTMMRSFLSKAGIRSIIIAFGLMFFQQFSGVNAVIFYSGQIFTDADVGIAGNDATIIVAVMQVVATFVASIVVEKLGRRILLIASDIVMALCGVILGVYFYLQKTWDPEDVKSIGWLPILSLSLFIVLFSLGYGPIPWMMVGEVVPKEIKAVVTSSACTFNWLAAFVVTKFFGDLTNSIGSDWTFYLFAAISFLGTIFVILFVPETKGKSLEEIQRELNGYPRGSVSDGQINDAYTVTENP